MFAEKIISSNLNNHSTLLDLTRFFNVNEHNDVEFWINNEFYYPDDNNRLIDLVFNPLINIIEISKRKYTQFNFLNLNCSSRGRLLTGIEKIEIKLFRNSKIIYVWEVLLENLEKKEQDLLESLNFRESLADNKSEIKTVEQTRNEIIELIKSFFKGN